jgi:hypothetical protein
LAFAPSGGEGAAVLFDDLAAHGQAHAGAGDF